MVNDRECSAKIRLRLKERFNVALHYSHLRGFTAVEKHSFLERLRWVPKDVTRSCSSCQTSSIIL